MSASLVGSEMCIRDRLFLFCERPRRIRPRRPHRQWERFGRRALAARPASGLQRSVATTTAAYGRVLPRSAAFCRVLPRAAVNNNNNNNNNGRILPRSAAFCRVLPRAAVHKEDALVRKGRWEGGRGSGQGVRGWA
eukprot:6971051-Alexandrium_andersonii.AAC.1